MDLTYNEILLQLLNNNKDNILFTDKLSVNIYLTLLTLNNNYYTIDIYNKEIETIEDFLRKINNLKVKIQLKRKEEEISILHNEIKEIYQNKKTLIDNYNINDLDIISLLDTLEPSTLTNLIDNLTKEKIQRTNHKDNYENIKNELINDDIISPYTITDNNISFTKNNLTISLDDFHTTFSYLLNIDNYPKKYQNLASSLIALITKKELPQIDTLIPITLTYLLTQDIDFQNINTNKFNILNIKITDLYSFAKNEHNSNTAKWKNINIPNEYLYHKINEISKKGTYYLDNDNFIMENIENNISDFKISIPISDMKDFLIENINTLNQSIQMD